MRKLLLFTFIIGAISGTSFAQSDINANKDELIITEKGKILEATIICLDFIEAPTKYNKFAQPFISLPSFPQKEDYKNKETLRLVIEEWFKSHPEQTEAIRKKRKAEHDKLYGERPF